MVTVEKNLAGEKIVCTRTVSLLTDFFCKINTMLVSANRAQSFLTLSLLSRSRDFDVRVTGHGHMGL